MMSIAGSMFPGSDRFHNRGHIGDEIRHIDGSLHYQDRLTYDIDRVSNSYVFL